MRKVLEKFFKWIFPPAVFILSIKPYEEIQDYMIVSGIIIAAVFLLNAFFLRNFHFSPERGKYLSLILPTLFLAGMFGALATIPNTVLKVFVSAVSVLIFGYYNLDFLQKPLKSDEDLFTFAAIFLVLNFLWGVGFYFVLSWWISTLLTFVVFFSVFSISIYRLGRENWEVLLWALICGLILVEVSWAVLFWPVHYLTAALVPFSIFYLVYIMGGLYFEHRLTSNKVYFQTGMITIVLLLSLLSSSWQPK